MGRNTKFSRLPAEKQQLVSELLHQTQRLTLDELVETLKGSRRHRAVAYRPGSLPRSAG